MMDVRNLFGTLAIASLAVIGCSDSVQEQSPGEVLARDSSLASDLRQADTSAFAEAADVAMAFDPDSAMDRPKVLAPTQSGSASPAEQPSNAPSGAPSAASVPMRVDRTPVAAPAPTRSPARPPLRPAPATIHPDPVPRPTLPAAPARTGERPASTTTASSAAGILARVPGASLPPVRTDMPCVSPAPTDQRRCLMLHLAHSDVSLDRTYQALIRQMKQDAGTPAGGREPETVHRLRVAQRAWLVYRDTECRRRNRGKEGELWAPIRAQCLGEFSATRQEELARALRER